MKQYTKIIDGVPVTKPKKEIVIHTQRTFIDRTGQEKVVQVQIINPKEDDLFNAGWTEYIESKSAIDQALTETKNNVLLYDSSSDVNEFYIGESSVWLDKVTRAGLKLRFEAESAVGQETTSL